MPVRAVLFDVDGTLVDSVDAHARAWQETFAEFGQHIPFEQVRGQIGKGGDQLMPALLPPDVLERDGKSMEHRRGEIFRERHLPDLRAFPAAADLLRRCAEAGLKVAFASSAKPEELEELKRIIGVADGVTAAETSSGDAERSKPHPDIFLAALERLPGVRAEETVVVGDSPYDAEAAGKAGIRAVGVLCGGFPEEALRRAGCVAIYRDPADLLARFDGSPLAPR